MLASKFAMSGTLPKASGYLEATQERPLTTTGQGSGVWSYHKITISTPRGTLGWERPIQRAA